jgi:DNA-directed RNA polymerase subunit RPC12/RpoP
MDITKEEDTGTGKPCEYCGYKICRPADVKSVGRKDNKRIIYVCGPCRSDKGRTWAKQTFGQREETGEKAHEYK